MGFAGPTVLAMMVLKLFCEKRVYLYRVRLYQITWEKDFLYRLSVSIEDRAKDLLKLTSKSVLFDSLAIGADKLLFTHSILNAKLVLDMSEVDLEKSPPIGQRNGYPVFDLNTINLQIV